MDAKEAREKSLSIKIGKQKIQYESIQKKIAKAVEDGYFLCYCYDPLLPAVEEQLQQEGFKIESNFDRNETTITISW